MHALFRARWTRTALLLGWVLCLLPLVVGCPPELPNTKVGAVCSKNADCSYRYDDNGKVVQLQVCVRNPAPDGYPADGEPKICTRDCQSRTDCPVGFECLSPGADLMVKQCLRCRGNFDCPVGTFCQESAAAGADGGGQSGARTCVEKAAPTGDFGKDCAIKGDADCNAGAGFFCHGELPDDPNAYCSKICTSDADCATTMFCGSANEDNVPVGKKRRCLLRTQCSSCRSDAECTGLNSLCVLDDRGRGYCTRGCNPDAKMPCTTAAASRGHLECKEAQKAGKGAEVVSACVPRYGRCYNEGNVCDPCRPHMPEDCQSCGPTGCTKIAGRGCVQTDKGEGLCLQTCKNVDECGDNTKIEGTLRCAAFGPDRYCSTSSSAITCWP